MVRGFTPALIGIVLLLGACRSDFEASDAGGTADDGDSAGDGDGDGDGDGCGDTCFTVPRAYGTGDRPVDLEVVDIDGDGMRDVLTLDADDETVSVLLGEGGGTLAGSVSYAAGDEPSAFATISVNPETDDDLDIVVVSGSSQGITTMFNTAGALIFAQAGNEFDLIGLPVVDVRTGITTPDENRVGVWMASPGSMGGAVVGYGIGTGLSSDFDLAPGSVGCHRVATTTLGADPFADAICASTSDVEASLTNFDGSDVSVAVFDMPGPVLALEFADLDADGSQDLIVTGGTPLGIWVWTDLDDAVTVGAPDITIAPTFVPHGLAVGDLNGDGLDDLAFADEAGERVAIYRQLPGGTLAFADPVFVDVDGTAPTLVAAVDLDGDGRDDLVVVSETQDRVVVLRGE